MLVQIDQDVYETHGSPVYIEVDDGDIYETRILIENRLTVHYDDNGRVVGIEVIG